MKSDKLQTIILSVMTILFVALCYSCDPVKSYIEEFDAFVTETEASSENYSEEDWEKADEKFASFVDEEYKKVAKKLTREDRKTVNQIKAKYLALRTKAVAKGLIDNMDQKLEEIIDGYDTFIEELTK